MTPRELAEIKRRLNPDKRNPTVIRGCYVAADGHIISAFTQSVHALPDSDNEKFMAVFRRALSGTQGQNLLPVDFPAATVAEGEEHHRLLMTLRDSGLKDDDAVDTLFTRVIDALMNDPNRPAEGAGDESAARWLILLLHDGYDVPHRGSDGENDRERSVDVFRYILCCVCPVKPTKEALSWFSDTATFHTRDASWNVGNPEAGFMFPAFENRGANIYGALYYTRDIADLHDVLVDRVFGLPSFMPAAEQRETFQTVLQESLAEECSMEVVQAVHDTVSSMVEERSTDKNAEPLTLSKTEMKAVLQSCGVSEERTDDFEQRYSEAFGEFAQMPAVNIVNPKQYKVATPSVQIQVDPAHSDLVQTRVIDGKRYILVLADGDVMVNGMTVNG